MVRKSLYPTYYDDPELQAFFQTSHIEHCIDSIRSSLMCSADISPMVWQWWEPSAKIEPRNDIVHTCRNFDAIREWAKENKVLGEVDYTVRPDDDDLVIEEF